MDHIDGGVIDGSMKCGGDVGLCVVAGDGCTGEKHARVKFVFCKRGVYVLRDAHMSRA